MSKNNLAKYILFALIIMISNYDIHSQNVSKVGTTSANFLEIGVGGNALSLGGAFVSIANDASALYWNVGGIANLNQYEAIIVHTDWIAETNFDYAGLVIPMGEFGTVGFSIASLSMDDMKVRTIELPDGTGEFFTASDLSIGISYARKLTDRFSIGFNAIFGI